jgi:hypothetical protein
VEQQEATKKCLDIIPHKMLTSNREHVRQCFSLMSYLQYYRNDQSLGLDGFPCKFYKAPREFVSSESLQIYEALYSRSLEVVNIQGPI